MLACFLDALPTAFLACADLDDAQSHPRVFGLPLSIAILAVTLAVPAFWIVTWKIGNTIR
jgi:hypothetical protein